MNAKRKCAICLIMFDDPAQWPREEPYRTTHLIQLRMLVPILTTRRRESEYVLLDEGFMRI